MSENESQPSQWEQMLRAVMGDEAAEQVLEQMRQAGVDPSQSMQAFEKMDFSVVMNQVRQMLGSSGEGPVNWKVGEQVAREYIQHQHFDTLTAAEGAHAREALSIASLWLDPAVQIDPCTGPNQAWSRLDWLAHSLPTFKRLTEPVAQNVARAFTEVITAQMEDLPEEMRSMLGGVDAQPMLANLMASLMGVQFGRGLAELATVSFGTSDAGLPLVEGQTAALVPANIADFGEGLDAPAEEVELFVAVREQAAARLYSRIPWLRARVIDSVAAYAREIAIDTEAIEEQVRESGFDPEKMQDFDMSEVFSSEPTESQTAALAQLEHLLSLVEGWVSAVALQVVTAQLPHAVALGEMFTRRAASSSPAQRVFGPLVGLQIRPRKLREAQRFWQLALAKLGVDGRDGLWTHPDLLPTAEDLGAPESFFEQPEPSAVEEELDAFLAQLLDEAAGDSEAAGAGGDGFAGGGETAGRDGPAEAGEGKHADGHDSGSADPGDTEAGGRRRSADDGGRTPPQGADG
ncbi:MAG: zinc-dependent metalloprotease [Actinomycetaceae bacterium]|nr:zinc-dependent metalloprotease [Actinomycetaceae bacterium]